MIVSGWQNIDELVTWCTDNVGCFIWTNSLTDWVGHGWTITRVSQGFKVDIIDEKLLVSGMLRWL